MNRSGMFACGMAVVAWTTVVLTAQDAPGSGAPARTTTADQQARGKTLYADKCSVCHQESLRGTGEYPPLIGDIFWLNWEPYNANNLLEQVRTTMPADAPASLTRQNYADIVAFIIKMNGVTLTTDLPTDADALTKVLLKKTP